MIGGAQAKGGERSSIAHTEADACTRGFMPLVRPGLRRWGRRQVGGRVDFASRSKQCQRTARSRIPIEIAGLHLVGDEGLGEFEQGCAPGGSQVARSLVVRQSPAVDEILHQPLAACSQSSEAMSDPGLAGRAKGRRLEQAFTLQHRAHAVHGDDVQREVGGEIECRPRDVQEEEKLIGAIFVEEVILAPMPAHLPEMLDHARDFGLGEGELIFIDIPVFDVAIALDQLVIGLDRIGAGIAAREAESCKQETVVFAGLGAVVDGVGEKPRVLTLVRTVQAQERMSEHRGWVVHIGCWKDERGAGGTDGLGPDIEARAGLRLQMVRIELQPFLQPAIARDEGALRMLHHLIIGRRREESVEGCPKLRFWIGLAMIGQKEAWAVDQAMMIGPEPVRPVVAKRTPSRFGCKLQPFGFGDELIEIGVVGGPGVMGEGAEEHQNDDQRTVWAAPRSSGCDQARSVFPTDRARCHETPPSAAGSAARDGEDQAST